jgi:hypothetical protein
MHKNQQKFLTCLRGDKKSSKLLLFLLIDSLFCCLEHLFESQDDFLSLLIFGECWQLYMLSGHLTPNFIWGFFLAAHILSLCSLMSSTLEKR